jgi:hypothetical protein
MAIANRPRRIVDLELESAEPSDQQALTHALPMAERSRSSPVRRPMPDHSPPLGHAEEPVTLTEPDC